MIHSYARRFGITGMMAACLTLACCGAYASAAIPTVTSALAASGSSVQSLTELEQQLQADLTALTQEEQLVTQDLQSVAQALAADSTAATGSSNSGAAATGANATGTTAGNATGSSNAGSTATGVAATGSSNAGSTATGATATGSGNSGSTATGANATGTTAGNATATTTAAAAPQNISELVLHGRIYSETDGVWSRWNGTHWVTVKNQKTLTRLGRVAGIQCSGAGSASCMVTASAPSSTAGSTASGTATNTTTPATGSTASGTATNTTTPATGSTASGTSTNTTTPAAGSTASGTATNTTTPATGSTASGTAANTTTPATGSTASGTATNTTTPATTATASSAAPVVKAVSSPNCWTGGGWPAGKSSLAVTGTVGSSLTDGKGNVWTLSPEATLLINGSPAGYSQDVAQAVVVNGTVYQQNVAGYWWSWNGTGWTDAAAVPAVTATTPTIASGITQPTAYTTTDASGTTTTLQCGQLLVNGQVQAGPLASYIPGTLPVITAGATTTTATTTTAANTTATTPAATSAPAATAATATNSTPASATTASNTTPAANATSTPATQNCTTGTTGTTTWNPDDMVYTNLSNNNQTMQTTSWSGVRTTTSKSSGAYCAQFTINQISANLAIALVPASVPLNVAPGADELGVAWYPDWGNGGTGQSIYSNDVTSPNASLSKEYTYVFGWATQNPGGSNAGDVVTWCADLTNQEVYISTPTMVAQGTPWNDSATANPATGTGGIPIAPSLAGQPLFFMGFAEEAGTEITINPAPGGLPAGYQPWDSSASCSAASSPAATSSTGTTGSSGGAVASGAGGTTTATTSTATPTSTAIAAGATSTCSATGTAAASCPGSSPSGTSTTTAATALTDCSGNSWNLVSGQPLENGNGVGNVSNATLLLFYNGNIYYEASNNSWYLWSTQDTGWTVAAGDPRTSAATTACVSGACGSANGTIVTSAPTTNLCNSGTATPVTGNGSFSWSCAGSNGGATASCTAAAASTGTGGFHVANGQIIAPNGQPFFARGINVLDSEMGTVSTSSAATPLLTLFPGLNFVRLAAENAGNGNFDGDSAASMTTFVNQLTSHGIVVEIEDHDTTDATYTNSSSPSLGQVTAWYTSVATAFNGNPYVWFGTPNEPGEGNSAQDLAVYQAIRATGNNTIIMLELMGGGNPPPSGQNYTSQGFYAALDPSAYTGMTNVIWDLHFYSGDEASTSSDQGTVNNSLSSLVNLIQYGSNLNSPEGTIPVMIGEFGNSISGNTGGDGDPNGSQVVAAVLSGTSIAGYSAWLWNWPGIGGIADNLVEPDNATLTSYGQQVSAAIR